MTSVRVQTGGRSWTFDAPRVVRIGREASSDVPLSALSASRRHAELRPDGDGWILVDVGSSAGTWLHGTRVTEVRVTGPVTVRLGEADGDTVTLTPLAAQRPAAPPAGMPPRDLDATVLPGVIPPVGPGMPPHPGHPVGPGVLVRTDGGSKRFPPGTVVRIGRDPANEVTVDDPSVSRLHGVLEGRPDGWWYVDRSTAGTFLEEDRVTSKRLEEPTTLMLGHPTAGVEVEVVPIVEAGQAQRALARKKLRRTMLRVGAAAAVLLLVAGGILAAVLLAGDDQPGEDTGLTAAELDRAKAASVFIVAVDETGQPIYTGSGSIVSEDGQILTNAHVGQPSAPGQHPPAEDPARLLVAIPPEDDLDAAVEIQYTAEPIVSDGVLDLAVLQITGDADGNAVDPEDLDLPEPMPLGDSDDLETGDELVAIGFPGLAALDLQDALRRGLTVTEGVASTFKAEEPIGERAWIDSDLRLGSGNSGGASINEDGELVGINSAVITSQTTEEGGVYTGGSALLRPVNLAEDILEIAAEGGDPSYVSPYLHEMEDQLPDEPGQAVTIEPAGWTTDGAATCAGRSSPSDPQTLTGVSPPTTIYAEYLVEGVPDGTPLSVQFWSLDATQQLDTLDGTWEDGPGEVCFVVSVSIPGDIDGLNAVLFVDDVQAENPVVLQ